MNIEELGLPVDVSEDITVSFEDGRRTYGFVDGAELVIKLTDDGDAVTEISLKRPARDPRPGNMIDRFGMVMPRDGVFADSQREDLANIGAALVSGASADLPHDSAYQYM